MGELPADEIVDRYGKDAVRAAARFEPQAFARRLAVRDALDPAFTRTWLDYSAGLLQRDRLDVQTRACVLAAQFTMTRHAGRLRDLLEFAVGEQLDLRMILESVLQCFVYGGDVILDGALETFLAVVEEHGLLDSLRAGQLPPDGHDRDRDLVAEQATWDPADASDPRTADYLARYGPLAVSSALRQRPGWALDVIARYDGVDPEFTQLWLDAIYRRMYTRGVLDDKTRLLCMIGGLLAIGETTQSQHHMRSALRCGARPQEIMEIAFTGCLLFGHPSNLGGGVAQLLRILEAEDAAPQGE
jgi:alkylhydroperoxidase/carboxymuconolactone decarboxylase family protein YurZ